jgi:hypothetical protein
MMFQLAILYTFVSCATTPLHPSIPTTMDLGRWSERNKMKSIFLVETEYGTCR